MIGNLYIYGIYGASINDKTNITFYSYNLNTDNITEIGTIKDVNVWTTFAVMPDGLIYFTMGIMENEDIMNKEIINNHYVMDVNKKTIEIIESDRIFPPLVYTYAVNEFEYIEFQPETIENGYRYNISIGNTDGELKKIIVKETNSNLKTGESITCVCVYDQKIYTCQNTFINGEIKNYLYTYDLEGNEIDKEDISFVKDYFKNPSMPIISRFSIFEKYYFIRSAYDGSSLILKKTDSGYEKINISEWLVYVDAGQNNFLLVNYENNDFYIFNSNTEQLTALDLPYNKIKILYSENKLLVYSDEGLYYYTID